MINKQNKIIKFNIECYKLCLKNFYVTILYKDFIVNNLHNIYKNIKKCGELLKLIFVI